MTADAIPLLRASHLRPFLATMCRIGAPTEKLLRESKLPLLAHDDPQAVVPELFAWDLTARVARSEGVEGFGALVATLFPAWQSEPALIRTLQRAPTLWAALRAFCVLVNHISTAAQFRIRRTGDYALFRRDRLPGVSGQDQTELYAVHVMIQIVQLAGGRQWKPPEVLVGEVNVRRLAASEPPVADRLRPCETCTGVLIPAGMLALPMHALAAEGGLPLPARLPDDFLGSLRGAITSYLRDGRPDIRLAAEMAGLSERTFQRRLERAGLSYRAVLDQVRMRQAVSMLREPGAHVTDIAYDLGFSDVAHFTRAFRRWTALSPREYRRQHSPL